MHAPHRSRSWSWLEDMPRRARLECAARRELPDLAYRRRQARAGPYDTWKATVDLGGGYPSRVATTEFDRRNPESVRVFADGPTESPHRYPTRRRTELCLWYPGDPRNQRWSVDDGLLALFGLAAHHLFKEYWWRETGEWLGEQAPHGGRDSDHLGRPPADITPAKETTR